MSDWNFLNKHRITKGFFESSKQDGFNGMFEFSVPGRNVPVRCICSNGEGWQHVSVSQRGSKNPPTWDVMCAIKDLFWEPEDWVVQFHPAKSEYVNNHPGCLHLWRPLKEKMPTPEWWLVGIKQV